MKTVHRISLTLAVVIVLLVGFFIITNAITKYTGFLVSEESGENDFEKCLGGKDIVLYINTQNSAEILGKIKLVDYLEHIAIKNCLRDNPGCVEQGVDSFPTWIIEENKINEDINIEQLSEASGCLVIG